MDNQKLEDFDFKDLDFVFEPQVVTTEYSGRTTTQPFANELKHVWLDGEDLMETYDEADLMELYQKKT